MAFVAKARDSYAWRERRGSLVQIGSRRGQDDTGPDRWVRAYQWWPCTRGLVRVCVQGGSSVWCCRGAGEASVRVCARMAGRVRAPGGTERRPWRGRGKGWAWPRGTAAGSIRPQGSAMRPVQGRACAGCVCAQPGNGEVKARRWRSAMVLAWRAWPKGAARRRRSGCACDVWRPLARCLAICHRGTRERHAMCVVWLRAQVPQPWCGRGGSGVWPQGQVHTHAGAWQGQGRGVAAACAAHWRGQTAAALGCWAERGRRRGSCRKR